MDLLYTTLKASEGIEIVVKDKNVANYKTEHRTMYFTAGQRYNWDSYNIIFMEITNSKQLNL